MSNPPYAALIRDFLSTGVIEPAPPLPENPGLLEFKAGEFTCSVFPLEGELQVVIQSEVMRLDQLTVEQAQAASMLLHGLNWAARVGNGIMAMIDAHGTVVVSKTSEIQRLDGKRLGEEMAAVLEAAENLAPVVKGSPRPPHSSASPPAASPLDIHRYA